MAYVAVLSAVAKPNGEIFPVASFRFLLAGLGIVLLWGLSGGLLAEPLQVGDGFVRGLPPGQSVTSAYLTLRNDSEEALRVVQATTPLAESIEFHTHSHVDGVMRMRRIEALDVPAEGELRLAPGGTHMMLIGLRRPLQDGEQVPLRLCGDGFTCLDVTLPVVSVLRQ